MEARKTLSALCASIVAPWMLCVACGDVEAKRTPTPPAFQGAVQIALPEPATGACAVDADGDGRDELLLCLADPGALLVFSDLGPELAPLAQPVVVDLPGYCLGPLAPRSSGVESGVPVVLASRETKELLWIDAQAPERGVVGRMSLALDPASIGCGDLDGDGRDETLVLGADGELCVISPERQVARGKLASTIPTCVAVREGRFAVGFQGDRTVREYAWRDGAARELRVTPFDGVPRALSVAGAERSGFVAAGGRGELVWLLETVERRELAGVPIDLGSRSTRDLGSPALGAEEELLFVTLHDAERWVLAGSDPASAVVPRDGEAGPSPWAVAVGDWDGDGAVDLAHVSAESATVALTFRAAREMPRATRVATPRYPHALATADLDGDGAPDVASLSAFEDLLSVWRNVDGSLAHAVGFPLGAGARRVRAGDVDGDGAADLVLLVEGAEEARLVLLRGDGAGGRAERDGMQVVPVGQSGADLVVQDLDGDGRAECVTCDAEADAVFVYRYDRASTQATRIELGPAPSALCVVRDADGAARSLGVALADGGAVLSLGRAGANGITRVQTTKPPRQVAAGDLDGDGRWDLVFACAASDSDPATLERFHATDSGWEAADVLHGAGKKPSDLACADLDGDGRVELLATAQFSTGVSVWCSDASTTGHGRAYVVGAGKGVLALAVTDLDLDGVLDLITANSYSHDLGVLRGVASEPE